ncbi:hypothetical protein [Candidatus Azoamicus ciliaticola]|uniref:Uncharacterized protein n=1 Tax=Candidatus Azoamicus ciliaticola TaxID=2652803 RepID=A0A6J5JWU1_9GAMM|nr:hypothetical protein [Candidatus Azoamicus ciliaticola]CAB3976405.1 Uncharacterised protein [Candidatus Azoamicus ciliaticola]
MKINSLCIELALDFCSITLKNYNKLYYKEYINVSQNTKTIIQAIDLILLESNMRYKDIDFIVFGDYPNNLMNSKAISIIIKSLFFTWKIPIMKINSLLTLSLEIFSLYENNSILIFIETNENTLLYCKCIFEKKKLLNFNIKELISIKEFEEKNLNNFILIINCDKKIVDFLKSNYRFMKIEENILPKSLYTNLIIEELILKKKELNHNNIKLSYLIKNSFIKYKY